MSLLRDNFNRKFVVTGEAAPVRGASTKELQNEANIIKPLMGKILGVNVVDMPGADLLMSSLGASIFLKVNGISPIYQITARDRNAMALEADLLAAAAFEIDDVLAISGDPPGCAASLHPKPKPVYELNSVTLIKMIKTLNAGYDLGGNKLDGKTNFFIGGAMSPISPSIESQIIRTKKKIDVGCDYFQTQAVFSVEPVMHFLDEYEKKFEEGIDNKVLIGVTFIRSYGMMKYLLKLPGIVIPDELQQRVKAVRKDPAKVEEIGIEICSELIDDIKNSGVKGAHIMPVGNANALKKLVENILK